jgi:hypothetical protein
MTDFGYICCVGLSLVAFVLSICTVVWLIKFKYSLPVSEPDFNKPYFYYPEFIKEEAFDKLAEQIYKSKTILDVRKCETRLLKYTNKFNCKYDYDFLKAAIVKKEKDFK